MDNCIINGSHGNLIMDSQGRLAELDNLFKALLVIQTDHHEIHEGAAFTYCAQSVLNLNDTLDLIITAGSTPNKWSHFIDVARGTKETNIKLYENPTFTGGTVATVFNRNRNSANTPETTVTTGTTVSNVGTLMCERHFGTGQSVGGETRGTEEWILKEGEDYLYRITSEAATNDISFSFNWYEHTGA